MKPGLAPVAGGMAGGGIGRTPAGRRRDGARVQGKRIAAAAGILFLLGLFALAEPANHDESQYVAAVAFMRDGLPFLDFAYLQTPLQPLLFAPFSLLPPGWLLVALRLVNALCVTATVGLVHRIARAEGASPRAALAAAALLLLSDAFIFAGVVARNDALPMLLFTGALGIGLALLRGGTPALAGAAGFLAAAAASAKISYAFPAVALGAMLLLQGALPLPRLVAFALGGLAGLVPTLALALAAWDAFWFGVIEYSLKAPQQWRMLTGQHGLLNPGIKLFRLAKFAALGAPLVALILVAADRVRGRSGGAAPLLLLDAVILASLVAAYLPDPSFRQYLIPVLPALFIRLGLTIDRIAPSARPVLAVLAMACAVAGLWRSVGHVAAATREGLPALVMAEDAATIAARAGNAPIVTLAPERVVGRGVNLDPRFVAGPFLFRIQGELAHRIPPGVPALTVERAVAAFDKAPPAVFLTGMEWKPSASYPNGLDDVLEDWAQARGYRRIPLRSPGMQLWLHPLMQNR